MKICNNLIVILLDSGRLCLLRRMRPGPTPILPRTPGRWPTSFPLPSGNQPTIVPQLPWLLQPLGCHQPKRRPSIPTSCPTIPTTRPAVPTACPSIPATRSSIPSSTFNTFRACLVTFGLIYVFLCSIKLQLPQLLPQCLNTTQCTPNSTPLPLKANTLLMFNRDWTVVNTLEMVTTVEKVWLKLWLLDTPVSH